MNQVQRAAGPVLGIQHLIDADNYLLGRWFPKGQLSLYLDTEKNIGVQSKIGEIYAEFFQWAYVSYYVHGPVLATYLLVKYYTDKRYVKRSCDEVKKRFKPTMQLMFSTSLVLWIFNKLIC